MPDLTNLDRYLTDQRQRFEDDLCQLLRIPSVSADRSYAGEIRRAADWVTSHLSQLGLSAELIETAGHPIVYAESPPVPGAPTVLVSMDDAAVRAHRPRRESVRPRGDG